MVALVIEMTGSLHRIWWLYLAVILTPAIMPHEPPYETVRGAFVLIGNRVAVTVQRNKSWKTGWI